MLADTYGLYYNKDQFKAAGIAGSPKTIAELTADAKKLTEVQLRRIDQVRGFDPFVGFYENTPDRWVTAWGASWLDSSKHSNLAKQAGWRADEVAEELHRLDRLQQARRAPPGT